MNSWPRSEASRETVKFWGQSFSLGHYPPIYQQAGKGFTYFYNPPNNCSRQTHVDRSCIFCGCFRVSLCRIVNQLFNFSVTGFCKKYSFVSHDRLKVKLECLLVSWPLFRRNKIRRWISNRTVDIV